MAEALDSAVLNAIEATLPTLRSKIHSGVFALARQLKVLPDIAELGRGNARLESILAAWLLRASPIVRTRDRPLVEKSFRNAWESVLFVAGESPLDLAVTAATRSTGTHATKRYRKPKQSLLARVCMELAAMNGDGSFFLSCRAASDAVDVPCRTVARWLAAFEADGLIEATVKGTYGTKRATRYRLVAAA